MHTLCSKVFLQLRRLIHAYNLLHPHQCCLNLSCTIICQDYLFPLPHLWIVYNALFFLFRAASGNRDNRAIESCLHYNILLLYFTSRISLSPTISIFIRLSIIISLFSSLGYESSPSSFPIKTLSDLDSIWMPLSKSHSFRSQT